MEREDCTCSPDELYLCESCSERQYDRLTELRSKYGEGKWEPGKDEHDPTL